MKTRAYPHVTGVYGDSGENQSAIAVHAVLDPSPNYPEAGRIIVGSPATTPTIPGYIPNLGGFNGGPVAIDRLASTLSEAARDVRAAMGANTDSPAPVKIDLDDLERKARAAESDEWQWRPANSDILEGKHNGQVVLAGEDLICSVSDRAHIATASPPVVLALIARIRELDEALVMAADCLGARHNPTTRAQFARSLWETIAKGAVLP